MLSYPVMAVNPLPLTMKRRLVAVHPLRLATQERGGLRQLVKPLPSVPPVDQMVAQTTFAIGLWILAVLTISSAESTLRERS